MTKDFYQAIKDRRSYYGISKEPVVSDERLKEIIDEVVTYTPSAFNSQTARIVLLLGDQHTKLWKITKDALRKIVPEENFPATSEKIDSFDAGYGTILYFEDTDTVKKLQEDFPLYKDNFPIWSKEASGMHQINLWTALELEGFGASLQHYSELIDDEVKKEWDLPKNWEMRGQMPFGKPTGQPGDKAVNPLEDRVRVFK